MTSLTAELAKPNGILPRNLKLKALLNFAFIVMQIPQVIYQDLMMDGDDDDDHLLHLW